MLQPKSYYQGLSKRLDLNGYVWGWYDADEQLHAFVKEHAETRERVDKTTYTISPRQWLTIRCSETEIEDGSLLLLIRLGMTR